MISGIAQAETIIYDNITTSNLKTLKIYDDLNYEYINEYKYEVYINGNFSGYYQKDELIFYPDNANVTIYIPESINTDISQTYDLSKPAIIIVAGFVMSFGLLFVGILFVIRKIWRR